MFICMVYICVCICVCMYIYIYIYIDVCVCIYIYTHSWMDGWMDGYVSTLSVFVVCSVDRGPLMGTPSAQKV